MDQKPEIDSESERTDEYESGFTTTGQKPHYRFRQQLKEELKRLKSPALQDAPIWLVASFTCLSGAVAILQPLAGRLMEHHPKLFSLVVPPEIYHFSKSLHVIFGLFLIYVSINIFKRKRRALTTAIILSILSAISHAARVGAEHIALIPNHDVAELIPLINIIFPLFAVVLLWYYRKRFTVKTERPTIGIGLRKVMVSLALVLAYGTIGFFLLEKKDFGIDFSFLESLKYCLREITLVGNQDLVPKSHFAKWFLNSLHVFGAFSAVYASYNLFRPIQYQLDTKPREREMALSLLKKYGSDALDNYKTLPDKSYFFLPNGNSFIAYKTVLHIAIGLGDPVAPPDELERVVKEFRQECHDNDWRIAFLQVKPNHISLYEKLGLDILKVGEEAIVDLERFTSKTVKNKDFKSKPKKLEKEGYTLVRLSPPHSDQILDELKRISDEWLALPGRRERGFSLGWFDRDSLRDDVIFALKDPEGKTIAFVNQVPSYEAGQASIDMMRHRESVPNGTMDFLFLKLLTALKEENFKTFNLGLAALSGVGDSPDASLKEKAIHEIYEHMNRFFSYKGLRRYKEKFEPNWRESFLVYEGGTRGLIKTALAITRAGELKDVENENDEPEDYQPR